MSEQPPLPTNNVTKLANAQYWLLPPILKENEAADTIFLEKSGRHSPRSNSSYGLCHQPAGDWA